MKVNKVCLLAYGLKQAESKVTGKHLKMRKNGTVGRTEIILGVLEMEVTLIYREIYVQN